MSVLTVLFVKGRNENLRQLLNCPVSPSGAQEKKDTVKTECCHSTAMQNVLEKINHKPT